MTEKIQFVWQELQRHFDTDDLTIVVSSRWKFTAHLLPDLQSAIEEQLEPLSPEVLGFQQLDEYSPMKLSDLTTSGGLYVVPRAPLQFQDIDIGEDQPYASRNNCLWLFKIANMRATVMMSKFLTRYGPKIQVEIAHLPDDVSHAFAKDLLRTIQEQCKRSRYYRNKVVSFESDDFSGTHETMRVHDLHAVSRNDVVLPKATMDQLDTHIFEFAKCREQLKRLGQSARKGILFHGHPGTGKTHVIRYLASNLPGHTTILVTAEQMLNMEEYFALARILQPCVMVFEDADLVARAREDISSQRAETRLNRLLYEMEGLGTDADILMFLTTNRLNSLEGALASRSGRVDLVLEIPLPDDDCRERLFRQYGYALNFQDEALAEAVVRSKGRSAADVKEMVRRLAQQSITRGGSLVISREDVEVVFADVEAVLNPLKRDEGTVKRHIIDHDDEEDCGSC